MEEPSKKKQKVGYTSDPSTWPKSFAELDLIHFRINSFYSFISTRNHIIPTFELIKPNVEAALKRELKIEDIAKIVALIPTGLSFKYVDETQITHNEEKVVKFNPNGEFVRKDVDMFKLKDLDKKDEKQVLLVEFIDGNPLKSRSNENYKRGKYDFDLDIDHSFDGTTLKNLINRRNVKFRDTVCKFLEDNDGNAMDRLTEISQQFIPQKIINLDPIDEMLQNKSKNGLVNNMDRPLICDLIEEINSSKDYKGQIVEDGVFKFGSKEPLYKELKFELPETIYHALKKVKKVDKLYYHQAEALNAIEENNHVIISTSTSSGKSLIYQLPAMKILHDYMSVEVGTKTPEEVFKNTPTAMYIFPTKALAQDQKRSLRELFDEVPLLENIVIETFDGDTETGMRKFVKENAKIIFTNPDMIHANILPNHQQWRSFLENLSFIVIDELHTYRGLFGSHVALVMRRLKRICHILGNDKIKFISCSATLKNPIHHMRLIFDINEKNENELPIVHIDKDGSPSGEKYLVVWSPPTIETTGKQLIQESFISETAKMIIKLVLKNIKTICFCVVRRTVELVMKEVRSILRSMNRLDIKNQIMSYRGGYSISDRRKIEKEMFEGNLKAIIATNALELGIDIGVLDAVLICGFPISMANFHQQSGRAGRRNKDSLTLFIGSSDPVNAHYIRNPKLLVEKNFQDITLDFNNFLIMENHLQCAAFEIPIHLESDRSFFMAPNSDNDSSLFEKIVKAHLLKDENGLYHCSQKYLPWPSKHVSLRGLEEEMFAVVDTTNNRNVIIEEIEASRTSFTLYEEGIMIHQGLPYIVREFNSDENYATVERVNVDWITRQRDFTDVNPVEIEKVRSQKMTDSDVPIYFGKIRTIINVFGFFKVDKRGKILDSVDVKNPPVILESKGLWIDIPFSTIEILSSKKLNFSAGIHGAQHAVINVLPLLIVSDFDEIQTECKAPEKEFAQRQTKRVRPARLIFSDSKGGKFGSGLCIKAFENIDEILLQAFERIENCKCEYGCPECVAGSYCKENSLVVSKPAALIILAMILNKKLDWSKIQDGPEKNLPDISIETIEPVKSHVKFAPDVEVIDAKNT